MILAWDNKADAATLTAGSEIVTLPGTNVQTPHLSRKWHTLAGVKSSHLLLDMGSQVACSMLALLGSNLSSAATVRLRASKTVAAATSALELDTGKMPAGAKAGYGSVYRHVAKGSIPALSGVTPAWAVDFTAGHMADLVGRVAIPFARTGATATRVNELGLIETVQADTPRFDHDPVTKAPLGLLIEEPRTNLCLRSDDLATTWANTRSSETVNVAAAPDGQISADKLVEDATASNSHLIAQTVTLTAAAHVFSVFLKAAERSFARLLINDGAGNFLSVYFNLSAGTVGNAANGGAYTGSAGSITHWGNGWYRCSLTGGAVAAAAHTVEIRIAEADADDSYTGDGVSGIYAWGAQVEAGAFATSYIPTAGASVTRNGDQNTALPVAGWFNQAEGTLWAEATPMVASTGLTRRLLYFDDTTTNERTILQISSSTVDLTVIDGGVTQAAVGSAGAIAAGTTFRAAGAYKVNDFAGCKDGATVGTDVSGTIPTITQLQIGHNNGNSYFNGWLRRLAYFQTRLTNTQLQQLTVAGAIEDSARSILALYWRIDIEDTTLPDNLQIGRVFLGPSWEHDQSLLYGWGVTPLDESQVEESYGGQSFPDARPKRRQLDFTLDHLTEAEIFDNVFAMARASGVVADVLVIPQEDGDYIPEQAVWGLCQAHKPLIHRLSQTYRQQFTVRERL
jgi:hypothetical protein